MRDELKIYEHIDNYLNGKLTDDELVQFDVQMKTDHKFSEAVILQNAANDIVIDHQLLNIKDKIKHIHTTGNGTGGSKWYWILGTAVVIIGGVFLIQTPKYEENHMPAGNDDANHKEIVEPAKVQPKTETIAKVESTAETSDSAVIDDSDIASTGIESSPPIVNKKDIPLTTYNQDIDKTIKPVETDRAEDCQLYIAEEAITIQPSCTGLQTGSVSINTQLINPGTKPYKFGLEGVTEIMASSEFRGLPAGVYELIMEDAAGCHTRNTVDGGQ